MQKEYFVICATVASHLTKTNHRFHLLARVCALWRQYCAFTAFFLCLHDMFILPTSLGARCRLQFGRGHSRPSRFKRLQTGKVGFRLHVQRQYEHPPNLFVGFSHGVLALSALVTEHRSFVPSPPTSIAASGSGRRCWDLWSARRRPFQPRPPTNHGHK